MYFMGYINQLRKFMYVANNYQIQLPWQQPQQHNRTAPVAAYTERLTTVHEHESESHRSLSSTKNLLIIIIIGIF